MSAGVIRMGRSVEEAVLAWCRLAPTIGIKPGLREIRPEKYQRMSTGECEWRNVTIISFGRKVFAQTKKPEGQDWFMSQINVYSEDGSSFRTYISLDGENFTQYTG
ncbi:MAG: hypothetical protein A2172_02745 [Candidatus Woykebacteria bacterium RBG_13_40_15]|uniref:Uncharacterized protein n=1 Tax=Candidatus Woykebacteria bacterium RBG_13_40_15 TaxID=1802593 RepID=A0A1G1W9Z0_9BACT|nr:MAG: hypothetical protein A2172_02745 [Candidatus Woykebacteria bacterium RBG_13_40_15]